ncbi:MAG: peptidylprolyl isomerase [Desulfomonilia bacterium]
MILAGCDAFQPTCCIRIGDVCIDRETLRSRLERFTEESMISSGEVLHTMKPMIVDNLIEEQLILMYAQENSIAVTDEEVDVAVHGFLDGMKKQDFEHVLTEECRNMNDIRAFVRTRAIINKTVDKAVRSSISISHEQEKKYYDKNAKEFYRPTSVEIYHVFVKNHQHAKEALAMLRSGVPLAQVVRQYSDSAEDDLGFMGVFAKGELPKEVEDVVFSIPERRYSNIIETQRGYHIFFVARRIAPGTRPFDEVADEIREKLTDEQFEVRYAQWIDELKTHYAIEVNWDEINALSVHG